MAYRGIHMTGITLNPFSPLGGSFDAARISGRPHAQPLPVMASAM